MPKPSSSSPSWEKSAALRCHDRLHPAHHVDQQPWEEVMITIDDVADLARMAVSLIGLIAVGVWLVRGVKED
jgi:hypothetical protein